jgi:hypothetical protein
MRIVHMIQYEQEVLQCHERHESGCTDHTQISYISGERTHIVLLREEGNDMLENHGQKSEQKKHSLQEENIKAEKTYTMHDQSD